MYKLLQPMYDACCSIEDMEYGYNTIKHENFHNLLDICFSLASYFSFTKAPWFSCSNIELANELEPCLIKEVKVKKWFGYDFSSRDQFLDINIYRATPSAKNILKKYFDDIFLNKEVNGQIIDSTQTLEDLCFFTETSLLLGTITHEYICHVYPPNQDIAQKIIQTGKWKYCEDADLTELINIKQMLN